MSNTIQIQVRIECETKYGTLHDALYFTIAEFFNLDGTRKLVDQQIETLASMRVSNYEKNIEDARKIPTEPPQTDEEVFANLPEEYVAKLLTWATNKAAKDTENLTIEELGL